MTYPNRHLLLTWHWGNGGLPAEVGQCGLRFDSPAPATQALVDAASGPVSTFWSAATPLIEHDYRLLFVRLVSLDVDGHYFPGTTSFDHTYTGSIPGGGGTITARFPLQVASVATLFTAQPRGQAYKGRIYLPWINAALNSGYAWQSADTANRANTLAARLSDLNAAMPGPLTIFSKGTKAAPTVGAKHAVTGVRIGDRPDVQRRRANRQVETYSILANVT